MTKTKDVATVENYLKDLLNRYLEVVELNNLLEKVYEEALDEIVHLNEVLEAEGIE